MLCLRRWRLKEALASYDRAIEVKPDLLVAMYNRATVLAGLERYPEALAGFEKTLSLSPRHVDALTNRANVLVKLERIDEALACYDQGLVLNSGHLDALANRGAAPPPSAGGGVDVRSGTRNQSGHVNSLSTGQRAARSRSPVRGFSPKERAIAIEPLNVDSFIGCGALFGLNRDREA